MRNACTHRKSQRRKTAALFSFWGNYLLKWRRKSVDIKWNLYIMDIYSRIKKTSGFDWDDGNSNKNPQKHGITNSETEEVFFNFNIIIADEQHSGDEQRYRLLGQTENETILFIVFTIRENTIRVISSRIANKKERNVYLQALKGNENE